MSNNNESIVLVIYRTIWLAVVAFGILWACSWADTGMRGVPPESRAPMGTP